MTTKAHVCDDWCICPLHETPLLYAPAHGDHACQDIECVHAHGGVIPGLIWEDFGLPRTEEIWP